MQDHLQEGGARSTGDRTLDRERVTARDASRWLGADTRDADGLDRPRRRLDVPAIPFEVRAKGRQVFERLSASGSASTDPEYIRLREYLECLAHLPWNLRTAAQVDLAQCGRSWTTACRPRRGEGTPPRSRRGTLWPGARARVRAQATAKELVDAAALLDDPRRGLGRGPPATAACRRQESRFVVDEVDRLSDRGDLQAAVAELFDSDQRAGFRDRYLKLPFDLSEAFFVATATRLRPVPSILHERLKVVEILGYTPEQKQVSAVEHLVAGGDPVDRSRRRSCRGHRRGVTVRDPRPGLGHRVVDSSGRARQVVPDGGAPPDRGRRVEGRRHVGDGRRRARRTDVVRHALIFGHGHGFTARNR